MGITMTAHEEYAFLVRCRYDPQGDANWLHIVDVGTGQDVHIDSGTLLLRIFVDPSGAILRCQVRHLASGREAYIQSSAHLKAFIKACTWRGNTSDPGKGDETEA
jgi:hypothetical protein